MPIVFEMEGTVHLNYVSIDQTVNQHYYVEVLKRLRFSVSHKRPKTQVSRVWALHYDNAPVDEAYSAQVFLKENVSIPIVQLGYTLFVNKIINLRLCWAGRLLRGIAT
jgi:hypothetical protein